MSAQSTEVSAIAHPDRTSSSGSGVVTVSEHRGSTDEWDEFVRGSDGSSFCHLSGWQRIIGDVLGHECIRRVAVAPDGAWEGILPLVRVKSRIFGHYLLSMPFLNYGGPLGTERGRRALTEDAVELARGSGVDLLEIKTRGREPMLPLTRVDRKVTVTLELPKSSEVLWKEGLPSKVRSQVRRPMKEGMTARFGADQMDPFYDVFARNMRDLGTPVLPKRFFRTLTEHLADQVEFGCVYHEEEPVAGGCGFVWGSEFEMTWASSLRAYNRMAPNMLLYWSFMERMVERGLTVFNFGRCTPGGGTHRFKLQWGGDDEPLPWGQWSPGGAAETPNPDRPLYRAATRVWSRLPLAVANRIGPRLARWFP